MSDQEQSAKKPETMAEAARLARAEGKPGGATSTEFKGGTIWAPEQCREAWNSGLPWRQAQFARTYFEHERGFDLATIPSDAARVLDWSLKGPGKPKRLSLVFPLVDPATRELCGLQVRQFNQDGTLIRHSNGEKRKAVNATSGHKGVYLLGDQAAERIVLVEGQESALAVYSTLGATVWATTTLGFNFRSWPVEPSRTFVLMLERGSEEFGRNQSAKLAAAGHNVLVAEPPQGNFPSDFRIEAKRGRPYKDANDAVLARDVQALIDVLENAQPVTETVAFKGQNASHGAPDGPDYRVLIRVGPGDYMRIANIAEQAMLERGLPIYLQDARLVTWEEIEGRTPDGKQTRTPQLREIDLPLMRELMERACRFEQPRQQGKKPGWIAIQPPEDVAKLILSRASRGRFPRVLGVISSPTISRAGEIINRPGLDEETGFFLAKLPAMPQGWDPTAIPSRDEALRALSSLKELLDECVFKDNASRSVALSGLLTPLSRGAVSVAPLHAVTAPEAGSGKGTIVHIASAISTGGHCAVIAASDNDQDELDKGIKAVLIAASPLASLDNLKGTLDSSLLCQAVEQPRVSVRNFGTLKEMMQLDSVTTWFTTGNNLDIGGDLTRRTINSALDVDMEQPAEKEYRKDPVAIVLADRGRYIADVLTIMRAHACAGFPGLQDLKPLASYGDWSKFVRAALVWLGEDDPCSTMKELRENDPVRMKLRPLYAAWPMNEEGYTSRQLCELATQDGYENLKEALLPIAGDRTGALHPTRLGKFLGPRRDKVIRLDLDGIGEIDRKLKSDKNRDKIQIWSMHQKEIEKP